jgi:uncharacterized protein involved in exopolysaccharide biosynthesis
MEDYFDNSDILKVLLRYKKQILVVLIISVVFSSVFSLFLKTKYKSEAVVYPANISPYSAETETEQLLQLCNSKDVMDSVIKNCKLISHYGVDTTEANYYSILANTFKDNVSFSKTEYESVIIEALDVNPQMACDIVNMIIAMINQKARIMQQEKSWEFVKVKQRQLESKKLEIDTMEASLRELRIRYGLLSYDVQVEELEKRYLKERVKPGYNPNAPASLEMTTQLKNLKEKGGEFIALNQYLLKERTFYNTIKEEYETALKDANKELTYTNVITYPKPSDTKAYPIRWLIVLGFALSAFMFTIVGIVLLEKYKLSTK